MKALFFIIYWILISSYPAYLMADPQQDTKIWPDGDDLLAIVDKEYGLKADYVPADLVHIDKYCNETPAGKYQLRSIIINDLQAMFQEARKLDHVLIIFSAYRSYQTQNLTYNYWVDKLGQQEADRVSARPGHSEHQLGTVIDVTVEGLKGNVYSVFGQSEAGKWLAANAYKYGFVMSYAPGSEELTGYQAEPWHFRYIGVETALKIHESGKCLYTFLRELHFTECQ
jgi:D-alanyl-D-alanine carboxypeptidase